MLYSTLQDSLGQRSPRQFPYGRHSRHSFRCVRYTVNIYQRLAGLVLLLSALLLSMNAVANQPPQFESLSSRTVSIGDVVEMTVTPKDADGDVPSVFLSNPPVGSTFNDAGNGSRIFRWTPDTVGLTTLVFVAEDARDRSLVVYQPVDITVLAQTTAVSNSPVTASESQPSGPTVSDQPSLPVYAAQTLAVGQRFSLVIQATSPRGVPGLLAYELPSGATFDDNRDGTRSINWTPDASQSGQYTVTIVATDAIDPAITASTSVVLQVGNSAQPAPVNPVSDAPVIEPIADQRVEPGDMVAVRVVPRSPLSHSIILNADPMPDGATFDDNRDGTRTFRWTPGAADVGTRNIRFTATDEVNRALSQSVLMTVWVGDSGSEPGFSAEPSDQSSDQSGDQSSAESAPDTPGNPTGAPQFDPVDSHVVSPGSRVTQVVRALNADGTVPALWMERGPSGATFEDNGNGARVFNWTPAASDAGDVDVDFIAADPRSVGLRSTLTMNVSVSGTSDSNRPPVIKTPPDQVVAVDQGLEVMLVATDPDGSVPGISLRNAPVDATLQDNMDGTRTLKWVPGADDIGIRTIDIVAQDNDDRSVYAEATFSVSITAAPPSGPVISADDRPATRGDASRFLTRATFGSKRSSVDALMNQTYRQWIDSQINAPLTDHLGLLDIRLREKAIFDSTSGENQFVRQQARLDVWWDVVVHAPDQLRQRVAFALSQILVIADRAAGIDNRVRGFASYNDLLLKHAFGNYRDLLLDVTLHPTMGDYLSMRRNEKADASLNIQPDENFARELMQLFTIGIDQLNSDGTPVRDNNGARVPAYTQENVANFARVFTGWNFGDAAIMRSDDRTPDSEVIPMKAFEQYHDTDPKPLLNGVTLPGGQSARQDLDQALDNLFNHRNVGPFLARRLIQRLVTSNPSGDYVQRVASVFNDNGDGVRGDLKAVVYAILLDEEALNGHRWAPYTFGKLKEPLIKVASIWRAFNAKGHYGRLRYSNPDTDLAQQPYSAPSVFNFYSPDYRPHGEIANNQLVAPEFQILNDSTVLRAADRLFDYAYATPLGGADRSTQHRIDLDLGIEKGMPSDPVALVDDLNSLLMGGDMSETTRNVLIELASNTPLDGDGDTRVREVLHMLFVSPDFSYHR